MLFNNSLSFSNVRVHSKTIGNCEMGFSRTLKYIYYFSTYLHNNKDKKCIECGLQKKRNTFFIMIFVLLVLKSIDTWGNFETYNPRYYK